MDTKHMVYPQIRLDISLIIDFRRYLSDHDYLMLNNETYIQKWNILCACSDRVESAAKYLNSKTLGKENVFGYSDAPDLMEFLTSSASMLDCINTMIKELNAKNKIEGSNIIFKHKKITDKESLSKKLARKKKDEPYVNEDDLYFKYIRSIGVIHPNSTNRHPYFQQYNNEVSPYLLWKTQGESEEGDIFLRIYDSKGLKDDRDLHLWLSEIYKYIIDRYGRVSVLTQELNSQIHNLKNKLREQKIQTRKKFSNYNDYLSNLYKEAEKRTYLLSGFIENTRKMIDIKKIPKNLQSKYLKYCNALKYAVEDFRKLLQSKVLNDNFSQEILLQELHLPELLKKEETNDTTYYYEKTNWLYNTCDHNRYNIQWAKIQAKNLYEIVKTYAPVDDEVFNNLSSLQLLAVLNTALYFYSLDYDTFINHKIPKSNKYR